MHLVTYLQLHAEYTNFFILFSCMSLYCLILDFPKLLENVVNEILDFKCGWSHFTFWLFLIIQIK